CRIAAQFNTSSNSTAVFELWLPLSSNWNSRFLTVGNGGWAGAVNYPDVGRGLKLNFASMSTNTGHNSSGGDGTWFQYQEQSFDFGYRALHLSVEYSKQIISAYYSTQQSYSYYWGCSTGGRQGFVEVQRFPNDFDGALIGDPVIWQTHEEAWEDYAGIGFYPNTSETFISVEQWDAIHEEALSQCDGIDGVLDGLISNPERCNFVPDTLLCQSTKANSTSCLTPLQLGNLKRLYGGWIENNTVVWPGVPVGSELQGLLYYTNAEVAGSYGLDYYRYAILNDSTWNSTAITIEDVKIAEQVETYGALASAYDPDLTAFHAKGGKILHYHGWQDSVVNTGISSMYYTNVLAHFASLGNATAVKVPDFYRLFMIPEMGHCQGGDGPWVIGAAGQPLESPSNDTMHNALLALVDWTEGGSAPEKIVATKYVNETTGGEVAYQRPICLWPEAPVFLGGDATKETSWEC
ncbi:tannase and feruloyl esterase, partial [Amniculicola lignicola CBS 123094]